MVDQIQMGNPVVVFGVIIAFGMLVTVLLLVRLMNMIKDSTGTQVQQPALAVAASGSAAPSVSAQGEDFSEETVAAITAAVACLWGQESSQNPFVITRISSVGRAARSEWSAAGMRQNTRSF
ncbi:OadG family transporter subunit [Oscillospiraceae bacterium MB08-C2-2]|nr:OadG family transporter subunit [Oscillospiraceae bacterium MB08-C2-2]